MLSNGGVFGFQYCRPLQANSLPKSEKTTQEITKKSFFLNAMPKGKDSQ
jgi:hypothetical protein